MLCLQASSSHIAHTRSVVSPSNGRRNVIVRVKASKPSAKSAAQKSVNYGTEWYEQTRNASKPFRTVKEEIEYRREANRLANNGRERKDLYTDNWDGSEYKGSPFNILTLIAVVSVLTPLLGLVFAYTTFGVLWG